MHSVLDAERRARVPAGLAALRPGVFAERAAAWGGSAESAGGSCPQRGILAPPQELVFFWDGVFLQGFSSVPSS